jgi:hypothetical protein
MRFELRAYNTSGWRYFAIALVLLLSSCDRRNPYEGKLIFTQVPLNSMSAEKLQAINSKYAPAMKIAIADIGKSLQNIEVLTQHFYSARSPEISFAGKELVFSGQKGEGDTWQIWRLDLKTNEFFRVTDSRTNCTDPTWLPNGDIAFSKLITEENSLKYHGLFTIGKDGCCEQRITFQPHDDVNSSVIHDGRLLVASRQVYPERGPLKYLALRPDGTKAEVFHLANTNSNSIGKATEDAIGSVLFCEDEALTSIRFNRPLHSRSAIDELSGDITHSVFVMNDGNLLVSIKKQEEPTFGISIFNSSNLANSEFHESNAEYHIIEPQLVQERAIPKILPTRVNPEVNYGYFMSMNADASDMEGKGKTAIIQVLGMSDVIGQTVVEGEGSFYLELPSDRPMRFQTLDETGDVVRGPSSWIWLRPNERRSCVGCHQDREVTPENIVPMAIKKGPFAMTR